MTERPILFSPLMVRAILAGTKTQTRRVVKPQPERDLNTFGWKWWHKSLNAGHLHTTANAMVRLMAPLCPYGQPGDRLWVRETHQLEVRYRSVWCRYLADGALLKVDAPAYPARVGVARPSIHMPRWASRITLEITEVRVERLQDISEEDAAAEGIEVDENGHAVRAGDIAWGGARSAFSDLWESLHGPGSWAANPWVWVVRFRRVTP